MRRIELRPILCNKYHCIAYLKMLLSSGNDRAGSVTIIKCNEREEIPLPFFNRAVVSKQTIPGF